VKEALKETHNDGFCNFAVSIKPRAILKKLEVSKGVSRHCLHGSCWLPGGRRGASLLQRE
jgi:hypothetical protein